MKLTDFQTIKLDVAPGTGINPPAGSVFEWHTLDESDNLVINYRLPDGTDKTFSSGGNTGGGTPIALEAVSGVVTIPGPGNYTHTPAGTETFVTSGFTSPFMSAELQITNGGLHTVNFPSSWYWESGSVPELQVSGVDIIYLSTFTRNGVVKILAKVLVTASSLPASGGVITYNAGDAIHTFTESGSLVVSEELTAEILIVAGGGAGGGYCAGGGGAGGLIHQTGYTLSPGTYSLTVGAGGVGYSVQTGGNGGNSVFGSLFTAIGGGGGGAYSTNNGVTGGSGGGGAHSTGLGAAGTSGQGNKGGDHGDNSNGGGGGGAGTAGQDGISGGAGGAGGVGLQLSITGTATYYAGGGGGWGNGASSGAGGLGGGGTGGQNEDRIYRDAVDHTGGGGGAAYTAVGGNGGSGIIIIRYTPTT